jgi:hypothetical protein
VVVVKAGSGEAVRSKSGGGNNVASSVQHQAEGLHFCALSGTLERLEVRHRAASRP